MPGKQITVSSEWTPSVSQRAAAQLLAIGSTWQYTADYCRVTVNTIGNWAKRPEFAALVDQVRENVWDRVAPAMMANVMLALEVQRQVLTGEIGGKDDRAIAADRLIGRFADRLVPVEDAAPDHPPAQAANAVQVNLNLNGHSNNGHGPLLLDGEAN